jgi:uncharacterized protein
MQRARRALCIAMIAVFMLTAGFCSIPCSAAPSTLSPPPEPLSGLETSLIVKEIYDRLGPRLGTYFVEANIVLTLAGARGFTEFYIDYPRAEDDNALQALNNTLEPHGLRVSRGLPIYDGAVSMVGIESLRGFERVSKLTRFPCYCSPFEARSGWDGLREWSAQAHKRADQEGLTKDDMMNITFGVRYGYPDIAIKDFLAWIASSRKIPTMDSSIPFVKRYSCAEPNFLFLPDHRGDPTIRATIDLFGTILRDFYGSPWHRERERDPIFLAARRANDENFNKERAEYQRRMASKAPREGTERTGGTTAHFYGLRLPPGADLLREIEKFAREQGISSGFIVTCCGSLTDASLRFAGAERLTKLTGKYEICSLTGTLSSSGGSHLHIALSDSQGRTLGGHLMEGSKVFTTAEIIIGSLEGLDFIRVWDTQSGYPELRFVEKK